MKNKRGNFFELKELEDHTWFPDTFRNYQTEFIGFVVEKLHVYDAFSVYIQSLQLKVKPMIDLCSGNGEAAVSVFKKCDCFSELILTDKFPGTKAGTNEKNIFQIEKADVLEMKFEAGNYYTMFNSFHHFTDEEKIKIAEKIKTAKSAAFFVEILEPEFFCFLKILSATTIGTLLFTPFVKPFSWKRLFFTYIIPVNIFTISFDGLISVSKSKSVRRFKKLFRENKSDIKIIRLGNKLLPLIVIQIGEIQ